MKKFKIILILMLFVTIATAQKKVAVFDPADDSNTGYAEIVREVLSTGLTNSFDYIPVERAMIQQVLQENQYQATGMVDESKISELGKQMGADYVCVAIIKKMGTNFFITAKLVNVTTATVELQQFVKTDNGDNDLFDKVVELSEKLFGKNNNGNSGIYTDNRDKQQYNWVKIGNQTWMAENLNYATTNGSWCFDCATYGRLYSYETAINVCPSGWHLPTNNEWQILINYAGGDEIAGVKLKSANSLWHESNIATNQFGFSVLPGGFYRNVIGGDPDMNGSMDYEGYAYFWCNSMGIIFNTSKKADKWNYNRNFGFSVRCIQD